MVAGKVASGFVCLCCRNKQRMTFAVRHLLEEPQNNFKVFKVSPAAVRMRSRSCFSGCSHSPHSERVQIPAVWS